VIEVPGYKHLAWRYVKPGAVVFLEGLRCGKPYAYGPHAVVSATDRVLRNSKGKRFEHREEDLLVEDKPMEVVNNTTYDVDQIMKALDIVGVCRNEWRQRHVVLYRFAPGQVISLGTAFDDSITVIALETDGDHANTLAAFPRTYVHE
jgi:hypothetical protein